MLVFKRTPLLLPKFRVILIAKSTQFSEPLRIHSKVVCSLIQYNYTFCTWFCCQKNVCVFCLIGQGTSRKPLMWKLALQSWVGHSLSIFMRSLNWLHATLWKILDNIHLMDNSLLLWSVKVRHLIRNTHNRAVPQLIESRPHFYTFVSEKIHVNIILLSVHRLPGRGFPLTLCMHFCLLYWTSSCRCFRRLQFQMSLSFSVPKNYPFITYSFSRNGEGLNALRPFQSWGTAHCRLFAIVCLLYSVFGCHLLRSQPKEEAPCCGDKESTYAAFDATTENV
jgi:hypothetical protein